MKRLCFLLALTLVGCGIDPGRNPDPVAVSGDVTLNGKPIGDVTLNLQPTGKGTQATLAVKAGKFRGSVTPGKYTYYFSEDAKSRSAFKAIPSAYHAGSMDRQVEISGSGPLNITLEK